MPQRRCRAPSLLFGTIRRRISLVFTQNDGTVLRQVVGIYCEMLFPYLLEKHPLKLIEVLTFRSRNEDNLLESMLAVIFLHFFKVCIRVVASKEIDLAEHKNRRNIACANLCQRSVHHVNLIVVKRVCHVNHMKENIRLPDFVER